ncbi:MAG: thioredoxin-disulfide reductase [Lactobacillales bacterium]|jgi:thioredoxin reductase (NADPH)|nr:thioredoxin-disulfide reductase [Lactobacillales bacterium]
MYDVIVIGAGPAGMTAALYAARTNLKVLLLEQGAPGGQMNNTAIIENYPGFFSIKGPELANKMYAPLVNFGVENRYGVVVEVKNLAKYKVVITEDNEYQTKTVVIATGASHRLLGIRGELDYGGLGVSYCAVCDGPFFRDKVLVVVGGGDSAIEEAVYLTRFASKVMIVHRRESLRAQKIIQERAFANPKISFFWNCIVDEIEGDDHLVTGVRLKDIKTGKYMEINCSGVFIYVGLYPMTAPFINLKIMDDSGWILTDEEMRTKIPGIFAIGDVRKKMLRQITTSVGEGGIAGQQVYLYLQDKKEV